jgi:hypothetical protein
MANPAAGLAALRRRLKPRGLMRIALYSERGRQAEVAAQNFVRTRAFDDSVGGMRAARAALSALPPEHAARRVTETPDFYTADGLHDLIFNVHESRTSPAGVKALLASCGLEAIAVEAPPSPAAEAFRRSYPDPRAQADLDLWEVVEAQHPDVFAHMIQVWCHAVR